ncbi:tryptophan--tRNA ligase [Candidatus Xianfuyuplasma coldseepsis]|uniref:Tryptophan--tRNA ligase n=1 Tax=Candidatus Xianfuyuplasma coldseepsis TaxID=2782163 RepID=A0A7L7KSB1_9MOLU|nr:tryptophan--tRNA ligase [Xianfuyuplasma coldseepsis]QMS85607.1 tryptophan--tRNA ligase [Xianfuyuplasma coldseepsis]
MKRILSGIQPTGSLNIGTYLGSVKNFVKLQDELPDYEFFIFIADLHAITVYKDKQELRKLIRELAALYIACGLRPERVNLFIQSEVPAHAQMAYLLQCNAYIGELERMTQYKDKSKKQETGVTVGLFTYPTLMAADILLYDPDFVPVGRDQKQHLELTRDIAQRVNNKYNDIFTVPEPLIAEVGAKINSLTDPTAKMSKSDANEKSRINLLDPEHIIKKRIRSAVTDSLGTITYDPEKRPGISNLMTIYSLIGNKSFDEIEAMYADKGYKEFKDDLGELIYQELKPIQDRYNELINSKELDDIFDKGRDAAYKVSQKKLFKLMNRIGLGRKR